jgi:tripartite-type tricarboxylate transporter receptor subunit TctC
MNNPWRRRAALAAVLAALAAFAAPSHAQADAPVRLIVPFAPGGATDLFARAVAQGLAERWGRPVLVDNRAGASGNIGAAEAARAPGDGRTLLMATSNHAINASLYRKLPYDLQRDFTPVTAVAQVPLVLAVHPSVGARSVAELVALARARPKSLSYASGSTGTASHLAGEMFAGASRTELLHVPYKGGAPALNDLLGAHVQLMFANLPEVLPHLRSGKLLALATTGAARHALLPEVPTLAEAGLAGVQAVSWFGLFVPSATPAPQVARLHADVAAVLRRPELRARLMEQGAEVTGDAPAEFAAHVRQEVAKWGRLVAQSGASAD